jgi:hypothetical protein
MWMEMFKLQRDPLIWSMFVVMHKTIKCNFNNVKAHSDLVYIYRNESHMFQKYMDILELHKGIHEFKKRF